MYISVNKFNVREEVSRLHRSACPVCKSYQVQGIHAHRSTRIAALCGNCAAFGLMGFTLIADARECYWGTILYKESKITICGGNAPDWVLQIGNSRLMWSQPTLDLSQMDKLDKLILIS
jgi:hypothetical protein